MLRQYMRKTVLTGAPKTVLTGAYKTVLVWGQSRKCSYIRVYKYTYKFLTVRVVLCKLFVSEHIVAFGSFWLPLGVTVYYASAFIRTILSHPVAGNLEASPLRVIQKCQKYKNSCG